jgi:hypothetical protein
MIDGHYGHLARDDAIKLLDTLSSSESSTPVDVRGRCVDVETATRR